MKKKSRARLVRPALCILALAVSLSASGCGLLTGPANGTVNVEGSRIYVIGQCEGVEFWDHVKEGAMEAGEELGYEVIYRAEGSITETDTQRKLIREAINDNADVIVLAANDPDALSKELSDAVEAGIQVLTIGSDTNFTGRRAYVGTINASSGAMAARHAAEFFTDYYLDKALIIEESEVALSTWDRLSGFIPALTGTIKTRASEAYALQTQQAAQTELEEATDIPLEVLNPARSSASVAAASGAPPDAIAKAVAGAVSAGAKAANIDPQIAARAAKLATDSQGGNGELAAQYTLEMMGVETTDEQPAAETTDTAQPAGDVAEQVNQAAQSAAKAAASQGAPAAAIAEAAAQAASSAAISLGADPGTAAQAAGQAAGMNGGDSAAASSAAAEAVANAAGGAQGNADADAQTGEAGADVKEQVNQAAQAAAKSAASQGAPAAAIAEAAANAASSAAISLGADPGTAAQAAGQAAGMNGGDSAAASSAAAEAVANAAGDAQGNADAQAADDSVDIPPEVLQAATTAAKTAHSNGAPAGGISQAAANAAATTALATGADVSAAAQAAAKAAAEYGGDPSAASAAATASYESGNSGNKEEGVSTPTTIQGGSPINAISPVQQVFDCKGDSKSAKDNVLAMLRSDTDHHIKVIFTTGERSTIGACEAVAEADMIGQVAIIGFNSNDTELTYLKNGTLSGLIVQNPYNMGYLGVYYAGRLLAGENVSPTIDTGATYVSRDNLNSDDIRLLLDPAEFTKK